MAKILLAKNADLFPLTLGTPKELHLRLPQISKIYELREPFLSPLLSSFLLSLMKQKEHMKQYLLLNLSGREGQFPTGQKGHDWVYPEKVGLEPGR